MGKAWVFLVGLSGREIAVSDGNDLGGSFQRVLNSDGGVWAQAPEGVGDLYLNKDEVLIVGSDGGAVRLQHQPCRGANRFKDGLLENGLSDEPLGAQSTRFIRD
jgi:hypothetical protein